MKICIGSHCYRSVQASSCVYACDTCDIYRDTKQKTGSDTPACFRKEYIRASDFCGNRAEEGHPMNFKRIY